MNVFKGYSSKSAASKAAKKSGQDPIQQDGQWGIMVPAQVTLEQAQAEAALDVQVGEVAIDTTTLDATGLGGTCPGCGIDLSNGVMHHLDPVNDTTVILTTGSFGCMACPAQWGPVPTARGQAPDMATLPLEAHGVKRPQRAGLCWEVWELAYRLQAGTGELPTVATMRAEAPHLNPTNVQIEYYNWRKYNGVRGRQRAA